MDMYGFYTGQVLNAYDFLGAHLMTDGAIFRTFAPNALRVSLLLANKEIPMQPVYDGNFYEVTVPGIKAGALYEYRIYKRSGDYTDHCDPYGFGMELRPAHKSVAVDLLTYRFNDHKWMSQRTDRLNQPLNIYEIHLGSWRKPSGNEWYRYDELAPLLIPYLKESGYNYVEFLPVSEHPCDESWGIRTQVFMRPLVAMERLII